MAEPSADLAELLQGIDRPRPLPAGLRHRLEATLAGTVYPASEVTAQMIEPSATQMIEPTAARALPPGLSDRLSGLILAEAGRPGDALEDKRSSARLAGRWQRVLAGAAAAAVLVAAGIGIGLHSAQPSRSSTTASGPPKGSGVSSTGGAISSGSPLSPTAGPAALGPIGGPQTAQSPTSSTAAAAASGTGSAASSGSAGGSAGTQPAPSPAAAAAPSPAPAVQSLSPRQGPATGGTWVTITGSHLGGATAVHFGSTAATHVVVEPNGQVRALSPAHLPGSVDVVVITPEGTTPTTPDDLFDFTT